jgi:HD-GYP domain-containing protein (c-di-GMP phosphodiesterase class II)
MVAFGVGMSREVFMLTVQTLGFYGIIPLSRLEPYFPPVEHLLSQLAVLLVAAAFIGYLRDNWALARSFAIAATAVTLACYAVTAPVYMRMALANPSLHFGQTWCDWAWRIPASILFLAAMWLGYRAGGPMANVFVFAMAFFFLDQSLMLIDLAQHDVTKAIWGPIRHALYLTGIPVLGYAYFREESQRRSLAEEAFAQKSEELRQTLHEAVQVAGTIAELRYEEELPRTLNETVRVAGTIAELRDPHAAAHASGVARLSDAIAVRLGLDDARRADLWLAAQLHDVGKVVIPQQVLLRPAGLTDEERRIVQEHPAVAGEILKGVTFTGPVVEIILQHHERLDGSGYPAHLLGDDMLPEARILAVADVACAMLCPRPYRPAKSLRETLQELRDGAGIRYDADAVQACVETLEMKGLKALEEDMPTPWAFAPKAAGYAAS